VPPTDPSVTYNQPCTRYLAPSGATQAEQVAGLNQYALCSSGGNGGIDFSRAGFGAANQYNLGVSGSINVFTGGRVQAQNAAAVAGRRSADIELSAQRAQLTLDVAQAYYDALLADRLVGIADSTLVLTERAYRQTSVARVVGNTSEFEQLRAQVQRDNQRPVVIQARTNRDIAYLRLKQLLNLPYEQALTLADDLGDGEAEVRQIAALGAVGASVTPEDTTAEERATVRELAEALRAQQAQARVARAERLPAVPLTTSYGRVAFPASGAPSWNNFLTNWTVSVGASVPLFTGGRIRGEEMVAKANVAETRARLEQTRELAALDAQQTIAQVRQAEAALAASRGTATQASRAFSIADVRYREGISTQLELAESRTQLQQALANRAIAARDYQVAQLRLALLKDLPLGAGASQQLQLQGQGGSSPNGAAGGAGGAGGAGQQQQPPRRATASITPGSGQ
jgi:outer membrane protein TolC